MFRVVKYDLSHSLIGTKRNTPLLVERHSAGPGMFLVRGEGGREGGREEGREGGGNGGEGRTKWVAESQCLECPVITCTFVQSIA